MADVAAILAGGPAFSALVASLLQPDDAVRSQAETVFEALKQHPDALVSNFLVALRQSPDVEHRQFSAIMLRKVCAREIARPDRCPNLSIGSNAPAQVLTKDDPPLWAKCNTATQVR